MALWIGPDGEWLRRATARRFTLGLERLAAGKFSVCLVCSVAKWAGARAAVTSAWGKLEDGESKTAGKGDFDAGDRRK